jgi:hypothetical protein
VAFETDARVGRVRHRLARVLSAVTKATWVAWVFAFAAMVSSVARYPEPAWVSPVMGLTGALALAGIVAMITSYVISMARWPSDARVTAWEGQLAVRRRGQVVTVPVSSAHASPAALGRAHVEITAPGGDVWEVELEEPAQASALVAELGFGPNGRPTTYRLAGRFRRFLHLAVGYGAYNFGSMIGGVVAMALMALLRPGPELMQLQLPAMLLGVLASYALGRRLVTAPTITVGNDGVRVVRFGFRERFYPLADIVRAEQLSYGAPIRLQLQSGHAVTVGGIGIDAQRRDALAEHIRTLLAARDALRTAQAESFARAGRSVRQWREHLRVLMEGGYRVASVALPKETLAELVAKPGAPIDQRVGAALALRVSGDSEAPARIRVAAEKCVDPHARAALEAAAAEEVRDDEIERLLQSG